MSAGGGASRDGTFLSENDVRTALARRGEHHVVFTVAILPPGTALAHLDWGAAAHALVAAQDAGYGSCACCAAPWTARRSIDSFVVAEFFGDRVAGIMAICEGCRSDRRLKGLIVERVAESIGLEAPELVVLGPEARA